jgi:glycosyltransferase involved in cell wall biosynthesis
VKIVLTVHQFLPEYGSGTEVLTLDTTKELQRLGHDVSVFTGFPEREAISDDRRFDAYVYQDVQVHRFRHAHVPLGGQDDITQAEYRNFFFAAHFRRFLENTKPDVVHFFHLGRLSASAVEVCDELGIPMVLTPTDFWFVCPTNQLRLPDGSMCSGPKWNAANCVRHVMELNQPLAIETRVAKKLPDPLLGLGIYGIQQGFFRNRFATTVNSLAARPVYLRKQLDRIERVLVPTHLMETILSSNGLKPHKITFAPYGIKETYLRRAPRRSHIAKLQVGFIGTLYEHKGVHLLVEAVRSLSSAFPLDLRIFGNTEDFPDYCAGLAKLANGDPRIQFCGTFPNSAIGEIFSSLDVLVVPSIWYENTPLVIYSAQAAGCPVVASDLGGMAEVVHHEANGLLFKPGSVVELAGSLQRLCEDRALLDRLAKRAITPRSIQDYVRQVESVYEDILFTS